jgi:hypothetical protein
MEKLFLYITKRTWTREATEVDIHTAEPQLETLSLEEVIIAIRKLKNNKAPGNDELITS